MRSRALIALCAVTLANFATSPAAGMYVGLEVVLQQVTLQNGTLMNRYRVYADFTDPQDYLTAVAGSPTIGNLVVESLNTDCTAPGSPFFSVPGAPLTAPTQAEIDMNPDFAHGTFITIGVSVADQAPGGDAIGQTPNFPGPNWGTYFSSNNAAWFTPGPVEQGRAGFPGDGDLLPRVLILQLTVSSTSNVMGTVAITGVNNIPLVGGQSFLAAGQTFSSCVIPAPGAGSVFALGWLGLRGRRRMSALSLRLETTS